MQGKEKFNQVILEPYALGRSSLTYSSFALKIPRSRVYVVYTVFQGTDSVTDMESDACYIRRRIQEHLDVGVAGPITASGIIIDLQKIEFQDESFGKEIARSIIPKGTPVRIIVTAAQYEMLRHYISIELMVFDIQQAFNDLCLAFRHQRFDGGKNFPAEGQNRLPEPIAVSLNISQITCRCSTWLLVDGMTAGYMVFDGEYKHGSAGYDDALFIRWCIDEFCESANLQGLIVDFRSLQYEWGDNLSASGDRFLRSDSPIRILVSAKNLEAFKGVIDNGQLVTDECGIFSVVTQLYLSKKENQPKENPLEKSEGLQKYLMLEKQLNERRNIATGSDAAKKQEQQLQLEMMGIWWNLDEDEMTWLGSRNQ